MATGDSSAEGSDKPFRFMDLPREMRDGVYDCLTTTVVPMLLPVEVDPRKRRTEYPTDYADIAVENAPNSSCLLVSKQFRHEYLETLRLSSSTTLSLVDHNNTIPSPPELTSSTLLHHIRHIDIKLVAECNQERFPTTHSAFCNCWHEMDQHQEYCMLEMASIIETVSSCQLSLCVLGSAQVESEPGDQLERLLSPITDLTGMTSIDVFHCPNIRPGVQNKVWQDYSPSSGPYATWTKEGGWIRHKVGAKDWSLKTDEARSELMHVDIGRSEQG